MEIESDVATLAAAIREGDRAALARAITLPGSPASLATWMP